MGKTGKKFANVKEASERSYVNNVNDRKRKTLMVQNTARALVQKFGDYKSYNFFLKCAWHLSEDDIWTSYEQATSKNVNNPVRYFVTICKAKMENYA